MRALTDTSDILVIGAGIVGVSTAIWLQRSGVSVTLIDRDEPGSATSYGNAGILASASVIPVPTPGILKKVPGMLLNPNKALFLKWSQLPRLLPFFYKYLLNSNSDSVFKISNALSYILYDTVEQHLEISKGTNAENYITTNDLIFGYSDKIAFENDRYSWDLKRKHGHKFSSLSRDDLAKYDKNLKNKFGFAVKCMNHGTISDPGVYISELFKSFVNKGGKFLKAEVKDILFDNFRNPIYLNTNNGDISCNKIVLTAGVWSAGLAKKLGVKIPLTSERGYHVEYHSPNIKFKAPVVISDSKFIIHSMQGRLRCAGLVEFGGIFQPESSHPFKLIEKKIETLFPQLKYERKTYWMGHRPSTTDSLPVIDISPNYNNVWLGYGHQHIGLSAGPKTGKILSEIILSKNTNRDLSRFSASRDGLIK